MLSCVHSWYPEQNCACIKVAVHARGEMHSITFAYCGDPSYLQVSRKHQLASHVKVILTRSFVAGPLFAYFGPKMKPLQRQIDQAPASGNKKMNNF
jgi:hypothetical protein